MSDPQTEFDSPWKDILQIYFEDFMRFFFPQAHGEVDWTHAPEFLDKELQQVMRDAKLGRRLADKLVKIYLKTGKEVWVLVHIEIQSQEESDFAQRMFIYNYRIYDCYKCSVASLAVLGDERSNWRPNQFGYQLFGCEVGFRFPIVKLLDYQSRWSELEASRNPFAVVVMTHLKAQQTRSDRTKRLQSKLELTKRLYELGFSREDIINLFKLIDWIMSLPEELEQEFWQEFRNFEESKSMPYITSVERLGIKKGKQEGLLEGISLGLKLKFGEAGQTLLPEIEAIQDVSLLKTILKALESVSTLEELRQIYQTHN
ncbi:cytosolic protein [Scytonema sp. NUACC26]|uniref:cytosolic protein n=1 Tax=Scytonema sp. NUACC26 TaxID=3140176 RepID=UPI0034DC132C